MGTIRVAWWNLENLFDTKDDPISRDFEYTPAKGWTEQAFAAKKSNLAAALNELHGGLGSELLGVAEIEGDDVFEDLIAAMGNPHLKVVKDPSGISDLRGIDVSLAHDERKLAVDRPGSRADERHPRLRAGDCRLPRRRHIPLRRLLEIPRGGESRHVLHCFDASGRGLREPLPGARPDRRFPRSAQADRSAARRRQC
jgi:Endonuclease/Exonuclease/phosphatase family